MAVSIPENSRILLQLDNSEQAASVLAKCLKKNNDLTLIDQKKTRDDLADSDFDSVIYIKDYARGELALNKNEILESQSNLTIFSSGTVKLKSFTYSFQYLLKQAVKFNQYLNLKSADYLQSLQLSSIAGLNLFTRSVASSGKLNFPNSSLKHSDFTNKVLSLVPTHLKLWSDSPLVLENLSRAKLILIGGEPVDLITERLVKEYKLPVIYTYAATELGGTVALKKPLKNYYQALPDVKFSLNNADKLVINNKIETEDIADLINDQQITNVSRDSDWVNSGGNKFKITDLSETFNQAFNFKNLHITKQIDAKFGESLVGYYQGDIEAEVINQWQEKNLPVYQRLKLEKLVDWPTSQNSKTKIVNGKS